MFTNLDSFVPSYNSEMAEAVSYEKSGKFRNSSRFQLPSNFKKRRKAKCKIQKNSKKRNRVS